ncbi:response regulator transcription factor [Paraliobacillus sediminis]|uniref:response regulator transcription factor n=1 Tax=Paraliobacillus sediminis TaxID=1885916 RepID=UPI000E3E1ED7|nr:response regulator [Paraliobacillus sediminis]
MTFKVLIVDDEPIICRGLTQTIPWENHDVEVIGVAHDGQDAINKIKANDQIDIVITDVRMPNKDGLQLAAHLADNYPAIKVIMISGYDEFSYAKQAIHLGVKEYLVKPVDIDELLQVVGKVIKEIKEVQLESTQFHYSAFMNAVYHQVFYDPGEVAVEFETLQNERVYPFISIMKNYIDVSKHMQHEELNDFKLKWKREIDNRLATDQFTSVSIYISVNILLTCILEDKNNLTPTELLPIAKDNASKQFIFNKTSIKLKNLYKTTNQLTEELKTLSIGEAEIITRSEIDEEAATKRLFPVDMQDSLIHAIVRFDRTQITEYTNQLFRYLKINHFLFEESVSVCSDVIKKVIETLQNLKQREKSTTYYYFNQSMDTLLTDSYQTLQKLFENDIEKIICAYKLTDIDDKDWLITRAIDYIQSYYKSEIKAHEVANVINISPNYFSSLFKQKTGRNFNEYVNHMRVEEAKTLLAQTPFKVSEIAEQVGFHEYKYFVEVFKKFSGMTPTTYRKLTAVKNG